MPEGTERDWFSPRDAGDVSGPEKEERLVDYAVAPGPTGISLASFASQQVLVPTAIFLTFLIALLAAAGVFDSGPGRTLPPITVTSVTPAVTQAATAETAQAAAPSSLASVPTTTLKPGDSGTQVKALQRELARLGFS